MTVLEIATALEAASIEIERQKRDKRGTNALRMVARTMRLAEKAGPIKPELVRGWANFIRTNFRDKSKDERLRQLADRLDGLLAN